MSETPDTGNLADPTPDQQTNNFESQDPSTSWEAASELRAGQEAWLARREIKDTPHLTMKQSEFDLLRDMGLDDPSYRIDEAKRSLGIPADSQHALVDVLPDDASQPRDTKLVIVGEHNFGIVIDRGRPEGDGVDLTSIPRISTNKRELTLLQLVGGDTNYTPSLLEDAKAIVGIPNEDQQTPQYALIDIESDDPNLPNTPLLVNMDEADFGSTIDPNVDAKYFQAPDSDDPLAPNSGGEVITVDIEDALYDAGGELRAFATQLMGEETVNPLSGRPFWVRAGDVTGQADAYVWENATPLADAIKLTIAFPGQYDSVCFVTGDRRPAGNEKDGMAQVYDPRVLLKVEGEEVLGRLQQVYKDLHRVPDFALDPEQRSRRDTLFNEQVFGLIAEAVITNQSGGVINSTSSAPPLRARPRP